MEKTPDARRRSLIKLGGLVTIAPLAYAHGSDMTRVNLWSTPSGRLIPDDQALQLRYTQAAGESAGTSVSEADLMLYEGLPIGNGRLGALVGGGRQKETLYLNDITLWSGQAKIMDPSYTDSGMGMYKSLGRLYVNLEHPQATQYQRVLDISNALLKTRYVADSVTYQRQIFSSFPDDVIVIRLTADKRAAYAGTVVLQDGGTRGAVTSADSHTLTLTYSGQLPNGESYATCVKLIPDDGTVHVDSQQLAFSACSGMTILVASSTSYDGVEAHNYLDGTTPATQALAALSRVTTASQFSFDQLLSKHLNDYQPLFGRMSVNLGASSAAQRAMTMPERLQARQLSAASDPELEALYCQYGRYLTLASSRRSLPMNLQGLWNTSDNPPWSGDYHTDINVEMNYWLADRAGLPECFTPFSDYVLNQYPAWEKLTQSSYQNNNIYKNSSGKVDGWAIAFSSNIYGAQGWYWHPAGNAWYCRTLWDHYEFTLDQSYLTKIYPVLKSACLFWQARLVPRSITDPITRITTQYLIDDIDWSPEHGDNEPGITYAQELVWDLFTNYIQASSILQADADFRQTVATLKQQLYLPVVSPKTKQLQEWMEDKVDEGDLTHRHLSPLIGFFPGERITLKSDPELLSGAKALLTARGLQSYGWAMAWRMACWAHFRDNLTAYSLLPYLLKPVTLENLNDNGVYINMLGGYGDKFQIDSSLGGPAAMLEMLLQSRLDEIHLLPVLPAAWPNGSITGLRARGGFMIAMSWSNSALDSVTLTSMGGTSTTLNYGSLKPVPIKIPLNSSITLNGDLT